MATTAGPDSTATTTAACQRNLPTDPTVLSANTIHSLLPTQTLIHHLHSSLSTATSTLHSPLRPTFPITPTSTLLLMPSWSLSPTSPYIGVKLVTSFPTNSSLSLPGVHASYVLFSSSTGQTLAFLDGTQLTLLRTAAVSALAARFLSRPDSTVLVMLGAGTLAPYLVRAHISVRSSISSVIIWNRTTQRAQDLAKSLSGEFPGVVFEHRKGLEGAIELGDIVSCATSSVIPIVKGLDLKPGAHLDLVGSFTPAMRECDDEAVARGRVFVDCDAAVEEAGELVGAFERGVLRKADLAGRRLVDLIEGKVEGRRNAEEVTVFKSVGSAVVDLLAAQLAYETHLQQGIP